MDVAFLSLLYRCVIYCVCIKNVFKTQFILAICVYYMYNRHIEYGGAGLKKRVNITLEDEVIERVDYFAKQHYTSRSGAITMLIVEGTTPVEDIMPSLESTPPSESTSLSGTWK